MPQTSDLIGTTEARQILGGVDRSTISRWVQIGKLEAAGRLAGEHSPFVFERSEVERLAAQLRDSGNAA